MKEKAMPASFLRSKPRRDQSADENENRLRHLPAYVQAEGRDPQADRGTVRRGSQADNSAFG
jgi:hypothetical protein